MNGRDGVDMARDEIYGKVMNSGIYEKAFEQGFKMGFEIGFERSLKENGFRTAIKFKKFLDVDIISSVTGFSIDELESEILNR